MMAIAAKTNSGPDRPTNGSTNKGARAGPTIVPRLKLLDSADSASTRAVRRVLEASDTAIVLAVQSVTAQSGRTMGWSQERLAVPRAVVSSVRARTLDRKRSWIVAGLTVVGVVALGEAFGLGTGLDGLLGGGGGSGKK